jgi:hypothetical protein
MADIFSIEGQKIFRRYVSPGVLSNIIILEQSGFKVRGFYRAGNNPPECVLELGTRRRDHVLTLRINANTSEPIGWSAVDKGKF